MNRREKTLATIVGCIAGTFVLAIGVRHVFLKPLRDLDAQTTTLRAKLGQINDERRAFFSAEDSLKGVARRSFGSDPDLASAASGKFITDQILRLELREADFSRTPVTPKRVLRGVQEAGWAVQGEGPLARMVDLLFVLEQSPQIHRIEGLVLSSGSRPGRVRARFRYLTLVVSGLTEPPATNLPPAFELDSPQRRSYDAIVRRDLLRPYVQRKTPPEQAPRTVAAAENPGNPEDRLKVVSLSEWSGVTEVHVCDLSTQKLTVYRPGDRFLEGCIVRVDYRPLPLPGKPDLLSYSRVIYQVDQEYWAVDQGQLLSSKYRLAPEQCPADLPRL